VNPTTWQEFQNQLPTKQKWVFKHLNLILEGQPVIQAITSSHAVAVSDGSFKDGQGTAAWMFYDLREPTTALGEGALTTPGTAQHKHKDPTRVNCLAYMG